MTVRLAQDGRIVLEGACLLEQADRLLELRTANPSAIIDWRDCEQAHSAVIQLLFVGEPTVIGPPSGAFLRQMIGPLLIKSPE